MTSRTFLSLLALTTTLGAAAITGCGGGGGDTGGNTGGNGGNASTSSSGSGTSTSSSSGGDGGAGAGKPCEDYPTPPPATTPVTIRLVNKSANNVYLGEKTPSCATNLGFTLEDASANQLKPSRDVCEFTCGELQSGACGCPANCAAPIVTLLAPNGHYDIGWPATVFEAIAMPKSCYQDPTCDTGTCLNEVTPPTGPLTMKASAFSMAAGCPGGTCQDCTPGTQGNCTVNTATMVSGTEVKGTVQWNGEGLVEIDFH
ncbi:MAG: hypothetical protein QM820_27470 [Minicystis sp.]